MFGPKNKLLHESWTSAKRFMALERLFIARWIVAAISGALAVLILLISCGFGEHLFFQAARGWQSRAILARQKLQHILATVAFVTLPPLLWLLSIWRLGTKSSKTF